MIPFPHVRLAPVRENIDPAITVRHRSRHMEFHTPCLAGGWTWDDKGRYSLETPRPLRICKKKKKNDGYWVTQWHESKRLVANPKRHTALATFEAGFCSDVSRLPIGFKDQQVSVMAVIRWPSFLIPIVKSKIPYYGSSPSTTCPQLELQGSSILS